MMFFEKLHNFMKVLFTFPFVDINSFLGRFLDHF
jgi:hypothetical protein